MRLTVNCLALACLAVSLFIVDFLNAGELEPPGPPAPTMVTLEQILLAANQVKKIYLTDAMVPGNEALTACTSGYHMASFFEVLDLRLLKYAKDEAGAFYPADWDIGGGFPWGQAATGWIRNGGINQGSTDAGANCLGWTGGEGGSTTFPAEHSVGALVSGFGIGVGTCSNKYHVWCVED